MILKEQLEEKKIDLITVLMEYIPEKGVVILF